MKTKNLIAHYKAIRFFYSMFKQGSNKNYCCLFHYLQYFFIKLPLIQKKYVGLVKYTLVKITCKLSM